MQTSFPFVPGTNVYCPTPTYTAGANEGAIISVQVDCTGVPPNGGVVAVKPVVQIGTGVDTALGHWIANRNNGATAMEMGAWSTYYTALVSGEVHTFKLQLYGSPSGNCYCNIVAQIFSM